MANKVTEHSRVKGFTLIEIMVVVAIIGILAAIGLPAMTTYLRTAESAEAIEQFERMGKGITGFQSSHAVSIATIASVINSNNSLTPGETTGLAKLIPNIAIPSDAAFAYVVSAADDGGDLAYCFKATGNSNSGADGSEILFSSSKVPLETGTAGWENHTNRAEYVAGQAIVAGGCCKADGSVDATATNCN